jgi:hypothetical protein
VRWTTTFQKLLSVIGDLDAEQALLLGQALTEKRPVSTTAPTDTIAIIEARLEVDRRCPHCQSAKVQKWGHAWLTSLYVPPVQGHVQRVDRHAVGATAQAGVVGG